MNRPGIFLVSVCIAVIAALGPAAVAGAFFERGSIDREFSYANLKIVRDFTDYGRPASGAYGGRHRGYKGSGDATRPRFFLQGAVENLSGDVQREVTIDFFAGDCVMGDVYWTTSVSIAAIKPYQKIPFRNFISFTPPRDPCKFRFSVVKAEHQPAPASEQKDEGLTEPFPAALASGGYATVRASPTQVSVEGEGSQLTETFALKRGRILLESTHRGNSDFQVLLLDDQGRTVAALVEASGRQQAARVIHVAQPGNFLLEVTADGPWSLRFAPPVDQAETEQEPEQEPTPAQIHLRDGRVIRAASCRVEENLVKYVKFGATIAIDRREVLETQNCTSAP
jgi:hypothetical protein